VLKQQRSIRAAITASKRATAPIRGLRFHDLRHQAITEMAEAGASDATLMAVAGHMSRRMLEHCAGKTGKWSDGRALANESIRVEESELKLHVTIHVTTTPSNSSSCLYLPEINGGRDRTRTCDLLRVKQAL